MKDRKANAAGKAMAPVTVAGAMAPNNNQTAMDEIAMLSFLTRELDQILCRLGAVIGLHLPAVETKLEDKELLPSTLLLTTERTVVPILSEPSGQGLRLSRPRSFLTVMGTTRCPGEMSSCGPRTRWSGAGISLATRQLRPPPTPPLRPHPQWPTLLCLRNHQRIKGCVAAVKAIRRRRPSPCRSPTTSRPRATTRTCLRSPTPRTRTKRRNVESASDES